jgi:hypothetical protein
MPGNPTRAAAAMTQLLYDHLGYATELAQVADLTRKINELERTMAQRDRLFAELEDVTGRPVEAIIASYRLIQSRYTTRQRPPRSATFPTAFA